MKKMIIFMALTLMGTSALFASGSRMQDSLALVALYDSTNGQGWTKALNWKSNASIDTWHGVTCDAGTGRVIKIELEKNNLYGNIPSNIGDLDSLQVLNINLNDLTGTIPEDIWLMSRLEVLKIYSSSTLSGVIPSVIKLNNLRELWIGGSGLSGVIPESIYNLTRLEILSIQNASISGTISSSIGNLVNLKTLQISGCSSIGGQIPAEVWGLTGLQYLLLNRNNLSGQLPEAIENLTGLFNLSLYSNNFDGSIPENIGNLTSLNTLNLYNNNFSGTLPTGMKNLNKLTMLNLSHNNFSGTIDVLTNNTNLCSIYVSDNNFSGRIPLTIKNLTKLTGLYLSNNSFNDTIPSEIGFLTNLNVVALNGNNFSGDVPQSFSNLTKLITLYLMNNELSGLPDLSGISSLTKMKVENNKFTFEDLEPNISIGDFSYSPQDSLGNRQNIEAAFGKPLLLNVNCAGNNNIYHWKKFSGSDTTYLGAGGESYEIASAGLEDGGSYFCDITNTSVPNLTIHSRPMNVSVALSGRDRDSLALVALYDSANGSGWKVSTGWKTNTPLDNWYGITVKNGRVSEINLNGDRLVGKIPAAIGNLDSLVVLTMNYDTLSGQIPSELGNLTSLRVLSLNNNELSGTIPAEIGNLTNLQSIDLNRNDLSGSIPSEIGNLINLTTLNLYGNQLSGPLPFEIGNLSHLTYLLLNDNLLSGTIPESIGNLTELTYLYLFRNNLTGVIPSQLNNLTKIVRLNLSQNELAGDAPIEALINLEYLDLAGNRLSGLPALSSGSALQTVRIANNCFTFEDIEPYVNVQYANYAPQDSVGEAVDTAVVIGNELILSVDVGGSQNHYQWFKGSTMMVNDTARTLTITSFTASDAGVYYCKITNTIADKLNLYSKKMRVRVDNGGVIPLKSIHEVQYVDNPQQNDSSKYLGQKLNIKGLVLTNPRDIYLGARWGVYITDKVNPAAPWTGILVIQHDTLNSKTNFENLRAGDFVSFIGTVEEYNGCTQFALDAANDQAVEIIGRNYQLPEPANLELSELLDKNAVESWEDALIKVNNLTVLDTADTFQRLPVKDSSNNQCYLAGRFLWFHSRLFNGLYHWPSKNTNINVAGIFRQVNEIDGSPGYTINPRSGLDVQIITPGTGEEKAVVTTNDATNITAAGAQLNGSITAKEKKVVDAYFVYGEHVPFAHKTVNILGGPIAEYSSVNSLYYQVNDLNANTAYSYRLIAVTEDADTVWGDEKSFTTSAAGALNAVTQEASDIMPRSATVSALVNPNGNTMSVSFIYGTDMNLLSGTHTIAAEPETVSGFADAACKAVIPGLTPNTVYYYQVVLVESGAAPVTGGINYFSTAMYEQNVNLSYTAPFPDKKKEDYTASDFRMFGIPGSSDIYLNDLINGQAGEDWTAFWDNGANENFLIKFDGSDDFRCRAGRGFWLLAKGSIVDVNREVVNVDLNEHSEAEIEVHNGWNIITNPFNDPIRWSDVINAESNYNITNLSDLWQFDGTFQKTDILNPYIGYYIHTDASMICFPYKPYNNKKTAKTAAVRNEEGWRVNVVLTSGAYTDRTTFLGAAEDAEELFDSYDQMKPHGVGEILNIYFEHPEWDMDGNVFASDIRPDFDEMERWDLTVNAAPGGAAELSFNGISGVGDEFGIYLIDNERAVVCNLREEESYRYTPALKSESFTILIGKEDALQGAIASVVPREFKAENNFPNPFNPETTIPLQIPEEADVSVVIYNVIGEKVAALFNGKLTAGRHLFTWHARNAPSGIYFYRISSSSLGKRLTGKMILMK